LTSVGGVRVIAFVEASKGLLVLLAGFGLLLIMHQDLQQLAEELVGHFHLNPASRYPRIFLEIAGNVSNGQMWLMAGFAVTYSGIRLIEAYGLWYQQRWAEWVAVASGGVYVPIELYELFTGISWIKIFTLSINIAILAYMSYVLTKSCESKLKNA
jgi:uncharacterized membrane protein (DUF2068 family)